MDFVDMKRYLDDLVERFKAATEEVELPGDICAAACNDRSILVYSGIEVIADIMNLKMKKKKLNLEGDEVYECYFMYRGVRFHHFERKDGEECQN